MPLHDWSAIPEERLNPSLRRKVIHTSAMTVARLWLDSGSLVPEHSHANEQVTTVEKGALKFILAGREQVVRAGETLEIPPHAPHSVVALEDSIALDLFSPRREDWIRGDDAYLRRK